MIATRFGANLQNRESSGDSAKRGNSGIPEIPQKIGGARKAESSGQWPPKSGPGWCYKRPRKSEPPARWVSMTSTRSVAQVLISRKFWKFREMQNFREIREYQGNHRMVPGSLAGPLPTPENRDPQAVSPRYRDRSGASNPHDRPLASGIPMEATRYGA